MEDVSISGNWSLTYGEWLESIYDPPAARTRFQNRVKPRIVVDTKNTWNWPANDRNDKDLLSPPPFFAPHLPNIFSYAMGKLGLYQKGLVLFELRDTKTDAGAGYTRFAALATEFAEFAFYGAQASSSDALDEVVVLPDFEPGDLENADGEITELDATPGWVRYSNGGDSFKVWATPAGGECFYHCCARYQVNDMSQNGVLRARLSVSGFLQQGAAGRVGTPAEYATLDDVDAMSRELGCEIVLHLNQYQNLRIDQRRVFNRGAGQTLNILFQTVLNDNNGHMSYLSLE
jgi:hypothetical protein